jgi:signal peptide peptidase SppA
MKDVPSALAAPWAIEPSWLRVVFGVWSRGQLDASSLAKAKADWESRKVSRPRLDEPGAPVEGTGGTLRIVGDVGVINIDGPLVRHASMFSDISGATSYDAIWRGLEAALSSRSVNSILLRFNSPGGEADGVSELAKGIAAAREHKPVYAYVDGMCASAAYWLASQAEHIVAEETSEIGSIGVRCGLVDYSAADAAAGVREIEVISSQSPGKRSKPVDDEVVGRLQMRIDDLAELFIAAVANGRGVDAETVLSDFGKGDVMIASKALDAGLIDEIGNFNGTLSAMPSAPINARAARAGASNMGKPKIENTAPTAGDAPEWQCAGCNEMMGPSAKAYCAKCSEDDEPDGDEDEDEAKAIGLDPKASAEARKLRKQALGDAAARLCAAAGKEKLEDALSCAEAALRDAPGLREQATKAAREAGRAELRGLLERGMAGAPGQAPVLSLGAIQKEFPSVLRGESKKAWAAAMEKLAVTADEAKTTITAAMVIDAACSIDLAAEDLDAVKENIAARAPVSAANHIEPERNPDAEAKDMSAIDIEITKAAAAARAAFDRKQPAAK